MGQEEHAKINKKSIKCNKTGVCCNEEEWICTMYENFCLKTVGKKTRKIAGYRWDLRDPEYVVCIVHGIGEYAGRYERVADRMRDAGIAVLSMDLRGHGISFGKRGHCAPRAEVLKDVDDLLLYAKQAYPEKPLILYGHSMGGNITLDYRKRGAQNHLPAGYIISAPWVQLVRPVTGPLYAAVKTLAKLAPSLTINSGVSSKELGNPHIVAGYEKDPLVHMKISALCAVDGFDTGTAMAEGKLEDNGGAKGTPVLLMHGTEDRICSVNGSRKIAAVENCEYIEWPGLYHEIHNGGQESTGDEVIEKAIQWIQAL